MKQKYKKLYEIYKTLYERIRNDRKFAGFIWALLGPFICWALLGPGPGPIHLLGPVGAIHLLGPVGAIHFPENPLFRKGLKTNFSEMGPGRLDT